MREIIQKEAIEALLNVSWGTAVLPVRAGKTFVGLTIAKSFNKVLVSYPNISIKDSWLNDSVKFGFNLNNIQFTTHLSLRNHTLSDFDLILLDEVHEISDKNWEFISYNWSKLNRLYGLTATPPKTGQKSRYFEEYCPIVYEKTLDETTGITNKDYKIIVHMLNPSEVKDIPLSKGGHWSEKAKIQFWENKANKSHQFMDTLKVIQAIQNSKTKFNYLKELSTKLDRLLVFVETQKQCEELGFHSYHSNNKDSKANLELFQEQAIDILVCVKQLSAGISFKNLSKAIILHCYASNNKFHQRFGRILNLVDNTEKEAEIHLLCLRGTKDELWVKKGLAEFDQSKIQYKTIT